MGRLKQVKLTPVYIVVTVISFLVNMDVLKDLSFTGFVFSEDIFDLL